MAKFLAECISAEVTTVGEKETPCASTCWKVKDGERAGETFFHNGWLTDGALPYTMKALEAAGLEGDDIVGDIASLVGNEAVIVTEEEVYEGVTREKIKFINAVGGGNVMKGQDRLEFGASLKDKVRALRAAQGKTDDGEEVPFNV